MDITDNEKQQLKEKFREEQDKKEIDYLLPDGQKITLSIPKIKRFLTRGNGKVTTEEAMMFLQLCKFRKLNPFLNDVYLVKYSDKYDATTVVSKEYFVKTARNNPNFEGMHAGVVVKNKESGEIIEREGAICHDDETLVGGWCIVHISNKKIPSTAKITLKEYIGKKGGGEVNSQWSKMPSTMIRKVAIVQALREAFPECFNGLYDESETNAMKEKPGYINGEVVDENKSLEQKPSQQINKMKEILREKDNDVEDAVAVPISENQEESSEPLAKEFNDDNIEF